MAIQIAYTDASGIAHPECYARVIFANFDPGARAGRVDVYLYHNVTTRRAGRLHFQAVPVFITPTTYGRFVDDSGPLAVSGNPIQRAYAAVKVLDPMFVGGLDV